MIPVPTYLPELTMILSPPRSSLHLTLPRAVNCTCTSPDLGSGNPSLVSPLTAHSGAMPRLNPRCHSTRVSSDKVASDSISRRGVIRKPPSPPAYKSPKSSRLSLVEQRRMRNVSLLKTGADTPGPGRLPSPKHTHQRALDDDNAAKTQPGARTERPLSWTPAAHCGRVAFVSASPR